MPRSAARKRTSASVVIDDNPDGFRNNQHDVGTRVEKRTLDRVTRDA